MPQPDAARPPDPANGGTAASGPAPAPASARPSAAVGADDGRFACPRCGADVDERFYGPCTGCRAELRQKLSAGERDVEREAFEPAMHVTPNAVALKDD